MKMDLTCRIDEKIHEISKCYIENFAPSEHDLSLFEGLGGVALFFYEKIHSDLCSGKDKEFFFELFDVIYDKLNEDDYTLTYCDGLVGVAFLIRVCKDYLSDNDYDVEQLLIDIDNVILESNNNYSDVLYDFNSLDFLHGKLGVLHYLMTFNVRPAFSEGFYDNIVLSLLKKLQIARNENVSINYGLAHGMCSYIHVIIKGIDAFSSKTSSLMLLKLIEEIYLDADVNFSNLSLYPSISNERDFERKASSFHPLGWCYGDQTISMSLYKLGVFLNSEKLLNHAYEISNHWKLRNNIFKALGNPLYYDFSFCHGVSSVAFFNKKWYDITGDSQFLENYNYFMELIVTQIQGNDNIAGFKKCTGNDLLYKKDWGVLTGVAGIALNLLYQRNKNNNKWLKLFLYE
ncbi:lanthionine synthetase LanC family protein [Chryseobacterium oryctis]|uniref:Lanthionine synthetase C-like protein n=1 Tax=Chryseobacterium oryctis TaxID=2952618 RepID=A0ABT3HQQ5_9FLAO|nr:lanthionine synthetase LanC family protein [Chryseobacterium oryctis]MCW3162122.1 hypothetical protein [Chryseobacterium oryctis]